MSAISDRQARIKTLFDAHGFVVDDALMPKAWLDELRATPAALLAAAPSTQAQAAFLDWEPQPDAQGRARVQRVRRPHALHPFFDRLARADFILDAVEALIGPDIRLHHSKINIKAPHVGSPLEWHQDWAFIPHTHAGMAIVAICLDEVAEDNGPVLFLPGSHRGPLHDHHSEGAFFGAIDPQTLPLDEAVHATGPAGMISIHHPFVVHGSGFNRGTHDRRILFYEYAAADAWPLFYGVQWNEFNGRIVRGSPTCRARMEALPVRMPYPTAAQGMGKIYDQQQKFAKKYFVAKPEQA
jgi:ectoine hydroxylase-related dioxygenase (phytanoyl-CoA dioxygenase family)